nr:MAG TPA: hypothetical protein [Caudoviricetes sp.]
MIIKRNDSYIPFFNAFLLWLNNGVLCKCNELGT